MKENIKKKIIALFGFVILAVCLSACSVKDPRRGLSKQLSIDLMKAEHLGIKDIDAKEFLEILRKEE